MAMKNMGTHRITTPLRSGSPIIKQKNPNAAMTDIRNQYPSLDKGFFTPFSSMLDIFSPSAISLEFVIFKSLLYELAFFDLYLLSWNR